MPTKKSDTYRCVRGFNFPASAAIRERLAAGESIPHEERGPMTRYEVDDIIPKADFPTHVSASYCEGRGFVEPVETAEPEVAPEPAAEPDVQPEVEPEPEPLPEPEPVEEASDGADR